MKYFLLLSACLIVVFQGNAQNTYPWPSTANIGIGTTSPASKLEVLGQTSSGMRLNGTSSDFEALSLFNTTASNLASGNGVVIQFYNNSNNLNGLKGASIRSISSNGFFGWESDLSFRVTKNNSYTTQSILDVMMIKGGSGYVGIGTTIPEARLHVQNNEVLSGTAGNSSLLMKVSNTCSTCNTNTFQSNLWLLRDNSGYSGWQSIKLHDAISIDNSYLAPGTDTKTWWERSPYQDIQSWGTAGNAYMTIKAGNVGIGSVAPEARLHVQNNAVLSGTAGTSSLLMKVSNTCSTCNTNTFQSNLWLVRDNSGGGDWQSIKLHDGISIDNAYLIPGNDTRTWWERSPKADIQSWGTAGNTYMTIKAGSVGIGTTSPDATLAVKGQIHAQEVKVDLNGAVAPDYVFEKDYALPSLESVKTYIDQNKHLPEVPSAKEMEANGINLSEMNMLLLKKVEELTLYVIEQQTQMKMMQSEINQLRDK